jgi:hypothetical protein
MTAIWMGHDTVNNAVRRRRLRFDGDRRSAAGSDHADLTWHEPVCEAEEIRDGLMVAVYRMYHGGKSFES